MALNLNNSLSAPTTAVIQVPGFVDEEDVCPICHSNELENSKGKPHTFISHEGQEGHVVHAKCLRVFIKQMVNQMGGVLPLGLIKCFHCQIALDQAGINNEVFETKIPKGLFPRTLKLVCKAPQIAQQITTGFSNLSHAQKILIEAPVAFGAGTMIGVHAVNLASIIYKQIAANNTKLQYGEIGITLEFILASLIGIVFLQLICKSAGISTTIFGNPATISTSEKIENLIRCLIIALLNRLIHET